MVAQALYTLENNVVIMVTAKTELGTNQIGQKTAIYTRRYDQGMVEVGFFKNTHTVHNELVESVTIIDQGEAIELNLQEWYESDSEYVPASKRTFKTKLQKAEFIKMFNHVAQPKP